MNKFILTIELVPRDSWYSNMRKVMTKEEWDILRRKIYAKYNYHCGICNDSGMMCCHEIWEYNDEKHIQTLNGFIALCAMCHHIKHMGFAKILADRGELNYNDLIKHFLRVNQCTIDEYAAYVDEAFDRWERRSEHIWTIDLGEYNYLRDKLNIH